MELYGIGVVLEDGDILPDAQGRISLMQSHLENDGSGGNTFVLADATDIPCLYRVAVSGGVLPAIKLYVGGTPAAPRFNITASIRWHGASKTVSQMKAEVDARLREFGCTKTYVVDTQETIPDNIVASFT